MNILDVIFIGVALSMDACALTFSNCTVYAPLNRKKEWAMPAAFGIFQALMPLIGYFLGSLFMGYLETLTGYITAGIFLVLGLKIIFDLIRENKENANKNKRISNSESEKPRFSFGILLLQAVATSIDALAIGVTFNTLTFSIFWAVTIIGAVTFILVSAALIFGKSLGKLFGSYAQWVGAIILFALSIKSIVSIYI